MSLINRMLKQTAVYWALAGNASAGVDYDQYGKPVYDTPFEISVRWEDVNVNVKLVDGTEVMSKATVYVDRDIDLDGLLMLGELTDITDSVNPELNDGASPIVKFDKLPTFRATEFLRTVYL